MALPITFRGLIGCKLRAPVEWEIETLKSAFINERMPEHLRVQARAELNGARPYQEIKAVVEAKKIATTPEALILPATQCMTPADQTLWAYTLCCMWDDLDHERPISALDFAVCTGLPARSEYERLWKIQKMTRAEVEKTKSTTGNWLDEASVWPLPQ